LINIVLKESERISGKISAFINFSYNERLISILRNQNQRFWHSDKKLWEIPDKNLISFINEIDDIPINITGEVISKNLNEINIPKNYKFKTTPFDHQIKGVLYGINNNNFLLADELGIGKTLQAINIAIIKKELYNYKHCLIICGVNGLKWNWQAEIKKHSNENSYILGLRTNKKGNEVIDGNKNKLNCLLNLPEDYFIITNIESLRDKNINKKINELINKNQINMVIIDEIHKCKNPQSQQGKAILKIKTESKIAMTGTPLMNNPMDLYIILKWLEIEKRTFWAFKNSYCTMGGFEGREIIGYKNLNELQIELDSIMLRRLKKDVLNLPEKIHTIDYVEMEPEQWKIYNEVKEELKQNIDLIKVGNNPLDQLIRLRQATATTNILSSTISKSAKFDRLEELVEELVANNKKCIIFSNWTSVVNPVFKLLKKYNPAIITGDIKEADRKKEEYKFMNDTNCKCIVGTIGAMGTGLTLTAGETVIFLDSPWNKANKEQAEDRTHRIGTISTINIITLVCKNTIDEKIEKIIEQKGKMSDLLVDFNKLSKNEISNLLDELLNN